MSTEDAAPASASASYIDCIVRVSGFFIGMLDFRRFWILAKNDAKCAGCCRCLLLAHYTPYRNRAATDRQQTTVFTTVPCVFFLCVCARLLRYASAKAAPPTPRTAPRAAPRRIAYRRPAPGPASPAACEIAHSKCVSLAPWPCAYSPTRYSDLSHRWSAPLPLLAIVAGRWALHARPRHGRRPRAPHENQFSRSRRTLHRATADSRPRPRPRAHPHTT